MNRIFWTNSLRLRTAENAETAEIKIGEAARLFVFLLILSAASALSAVPRWNDRKSATDIILLGNTLDFPAVPCDHNTVASLIISCKRSVPWIGVSLCA